VRSCRKEALSDGVNGRGSTEVDGFGVGEDVALVAELTPPEIFGSLAMPPDGGGAALFVRSPGIDWLHPAPAGRDLDAT
jgi:hypothetical protein